MVPAIRDDHATVGGDGEPELPPPPGVRVSRCPKAPSQRRNSPVRQRYVEGDVSITKSSAVAEASLQRQANRAQLLPRTAAGTCADVNRPGVPHVLPDAHLHCGRNRLSGHGNVQAGVPVSELSAVAEAIVQWQWDGAQRAPRAIRRAGAEVDLPAILQALPDANLDADYAPTLSRCPSSRHGDSPSAATATSTSPRGTYETRRWRWAAVDTKQAPSRLVTSEGRPRSRSIQEGPSMPTTPLHSDSPAVVDGPSIRGCSPATLGARQPRPGHCLYSGDIVGLGDHRPPTVRPQEENSYRRAGRWAPSLRVSLVARTIPSPTIRRRKFRLSTGSSRIAS